MDAAFNITRRCNKGCDFCYLRLTGEDLPFETFKEIVDSAQPKTVTLTGGEPLLHPAFESFLGLLAEQGRHIHLLTNAIELNGKMDAIVKSGAELYVTYNASEKKILDALHEAHRRGVEINIHHVLSVESAEGLENICSEARFAKSISYLYPTSSEHNSVVMYGPERWFPLVEHALEIARTQGIPAYFEQAFARKGTALAVNPPCPTGKDIFIDVDGTSYPCCLLTDTMEGMKSHGPVKLEAGRCTFMKKYALPDDSPYVRLCPIVLTNALDGEQAFPSHLGEKDG